jgi:hypothetical protein
MDFPEVPLYVPHPPHPTTRPMRIFVNQPTMVSRKAPFVRLFEIPDMRGIMNEYLHWDEFITLGSVCVTLYGIVSGKNVSPAERTHMLDKYIVQPLMTCFNVDMKQRMQTLTLPNGGNLFLRTYLQQNHKEAIRILTSQANQAATDAFGNLMQLPCQTTVLPFGGEYETLQILSKAGINQLAITTLPNGSLAFPNIKEHLIKDKYTPQEQITFLMTQVPQATLQTTDQDAYVALARLDKALKISVKPLMYYTNLYLADCPVVIKNAPMTLGVFIHRLMWGIKRFPGWVMEIHTEEKASLDFLTAHNRHTAFGFPLGLEGWARQSKNGKPDLSHIKPLTKYDTKHLLKQRKMYTALKLRWQQKQNALLKQVKIRSAMNKVLQLVTEGKLNTEEQKLQDLNVMMSKEKLDVVDLQLILDIIASQYPSTSSTSSTSSTPPSTSTPIRVLQKRPHSQVDVIDLSSSKRARV